MNAEQIEMMSRIKKTLNDAGYSLSEFNLKDEWTGQGREYRSVIELRAKEKEADHA